MKRGLVVLDPAEVPEGEWRGRVAALQDTLAAEQVDVGLVYGDVYASDDIAYLTNLCVYWNEGVLAVPATGDPVFLTKLSPRVHPWMRRVSTVSRIESGKDFGALAAKLLDGAPAGTVGLVDAALWPAHVAEQVRAALPGWRVRDLGGLVRERRTVASAREVALLRTGGEVVGRAADEAVRDGLGGFERVSVAERVVRGAGFLDVQVGRSSTADGVECVRVTGQFRTGWLQAGRLAGSAPWTLALDDALAAAVSAARAGASPGDLAKAASPALEGLPEGADAQVGWVNQSDLSSGGEYRAEVESLAPGNVGAVTVDVLFADGGYAAVADTVLITSGAARRLTAAPAPTTADTTGRASA
ncbi:aminopeptidase P family N-terminal domain-containing protein [Streptomyces sp. NRRL F-5126]|uniref:aminopeptidase P family N-terminal domain-containing protein n=1 Tax=Streptomyces sp. NRRL F-5126 TaxID=1463857 RepID=UPI0004C7C96A|nr:aminopeptidase P family N-terminal domain-containing protein [Streptomyces sp. NRRL F-5126]